MAALFINNLTNIDFSYFDSKRGIVGESLLLDIILDGDLDQQSMVLDFGLVKPLVKSNIEALLDHKLLLPSHSPHVHRLDSDPIFYRQESGNIQLLLQDHTGGSYWLNTPASGITLLPCEHIDEATLSELASNHLKPKFEHNIEKLSLHLKPERIDSPFYHYSHGLKKHNGACQRIVHGHRSRIEIYDGRGQRSQQWEQYWAEKWHDIYVASEEDVIKRCRIQDSDYIHFGYLASEGWFEWIMPASRCQMLSTDSTVECIATFFAEQMKTLVPNETFSIRAFEGINKGAIA